MLPLVVHQNKKAFTVCPLPKRGNFLNGQLLSCEIRFTPDRTEFRRWTLVPAPRLLVQILRAPVSIPPIQSRGATIRARGEVPQRIAGPIKAGMLVSSAARSGLRLQLPSLQRRPLRADRAPPPPLPPPPRLRLLMLQRHRHPSPPRLRLLLQRHRHPSPLPPSAEMELARRPSSPRQAPSPSIETRPAPSPPLPPSPRLRRPRPRRRASSPSPRRRPMRRRRISRLSP